MKRFYKSIEIRAGVFGVNYKGIVFAGISFRDQKDHTVQITK